MEEKSQIMDKDFKFISKEVMKLAKEEFEEIFHHIEGSEARIQWKTSLSVENLQIPIFSETPSFERQELVHKGNVITGKNESREIKIQKSNHDKKISNEPETQEGNKKSSNTFGKKNVEIKNTNTDSKPYGDSYKPLNVEKKKNQIGKTKNEHHEKDQEMIEKERMIREKFERCEAVVNTDTLFQLNKKTILDLSPTMRRRTKNSPKKSENSPFSEKPPLSPPMKRKRSSKSKKQQKGFSMLVSMESDYESDCEEFEEQDEICMEDMSDDDMGVFSDDDDDDEVQKPSRKLNFMT